MLSQILIGWCRWLRCAFTHRLFPAWFSRRTPPRKLNRWLNPGDTLVDDKGNAATVIHADSAGVRASRFDGHIYVRSKRGFLKQYDPCFPVAAGPLLSYIDATSKKS